MISPQHFQHQAALTAWSAESIARMAALNPWGIEYVEFDASLLAQGRLKASHLYVRYADGTLIDTDNADPLPPVLVLPERSELTVVLALPHEQMAATACVRTINRRARCAGDLAGGRYETVMVTIAARSR